MNITFTIPDAKATRIIDGICGNLNYQTTIQADNKDIPNPETKNQFAKRMIIQLMKDHVIAYERRLAQETAGQTVAADVNGIAIT